MSEHAGIDPRVAAAEEAADPRTEETDATQVAEDPATPPPGDDEPYR